MQVPPSMGQVLRGADLLSHAQLESDSFKIYAYKIVPCAKKFGHDWSECPFSHEGEKATRRCPALYLYSSIVCPDVRQSKPCPRGDVCPYSHSIFEYWMHPARFRAQMCSFGSECNRRICFFAHAQEQLRVPSEPIVADALASRAPYLQGRVCPKSRYALYPEQVPPAIPLAGVLPPALLGQSELAGAGQGMPQMLLVPAGDPAAGGVAMGAAGGQMAGLQQQQQPWAQGANMVFVPAGQPGGPAGLGYYMPAGAGAAAAGGMAAGGMGPQQQQFSGAMALQQGGGLQMAAGPAGGSYGGSQPMQLVAAMGPDGSIAQYSVAAGGMAFAPPGAMYSSSMSPAALSMPMQQPWAAMQQQGQQQGQQQQQQGGPQQQQQQSQQLRQGQQQQLQLVQVAKPGEGAIGQAGGQEQGSFLMSQPPAPFSQPRSVDGGGYSVLPAGASVVNAPAAPSPGGGAGTSGGAGAAGGVAAAGEGGQPGVDDLAQQMGGWRIT